MCRGPRDARELLKFVPSHHYLISPTENYPMTSPTTRGSWTSASSLDRAYAVPRSWSWLPRRAGFSSVGNDNALYCADRFLSGEIWTGFGAAGRGAVGHRR
jgi:hypothetical protein